MAYKDDVKQWFETGDFPTQSQFWQKFDWQRWKDEKITEADLDPALLAAINSYVRVITLAPGVLQRDVRRDTLLEKFFIQSTVVGAALTVSVGTTPAGTDIWDNEAVDLTDPMNGMLTKDHYCFADETIYFTITGAPAGSITIKIYKS